MQTNTFQTKYTLSKPILLTSIFILFALNSVAQDVNWQKWIGCAYNNIHEIPYFKDVIGNAGHLLPNRSFRITDNVRKGRHFIFLERLLTKGDKRSKIIQVLDPGKILAGEEVYISGCYLSGKRNDYIIAIAKGANSDYEMLRNIRKAYKIDLASERFIPINARQVRCENEAYGH